MRVQIAGAGFSGLTLGYLLAKQGVQVDVVEKETFAGGIIQTQRRPELFAESAANGLLLTKPVEDMFLDLNVPMLRAQRKARRRYIYRGGLRRWPLRLNETLELGFKFIKAWASKSLKPRPLESVENWGHRCLGRAATEFLLSPALQGIYAGDIRQLSASLIFKRPQNKYRGLVAPAGGMSELMEALTEYIRKNGGSVSCGEIADPRKPGTICAISAQEFQKHFYPGLELLNLVKVTVHWKSPRRKIHGFGVLFPRGQGFRALGVLSCEDIFGRKLERNTESWILGGAMDPSVLNLSDQEILDLIRQDRNRLLNDQPEIEQISVIRWRNTLPHYTVALEAFTNDFENKNHRFFTGNYLGQLGLSKIFERNQKIAKEWRAYVH